MNKVVVIGASGHGKVVASLAESLGYDVVGFADDNSNISFLESWPVKRPREWEKNKYLFALGIGNPRHRQRFFLDLINDGCDPLTLVHPAAVVDKSVRIGRGTVICSGAIISVGVNIGDGAILNTGCVVDHDTIVGDFAHICPGTCLAGEVKIGIGSWIGIGASVNQRLNIGNWVMVGAGSAVISDLAQETIAVGVPAKIKKTKSYF